MQQLHPFYRLMSPGYFCLIISLPLGAFPSAGPCIRCCANADLVSFFYSNALASKLGYVIDCGMGPWSRSQDLITWGPIRAANAFEEGQPSVLCQMHGIWQICKYQAEIPMWRPCCITEALTGSGAVAAVAFMSVLIQMWQLKQLIKHSKAVCCKWHMLWLRGSIQSWEPRFIVPSRLTFWFT